jgi:transglutaminase-like putative cysteine protease
MSAALPTSTPAATRCGCVLAPALLLMASGVAAEALSVAARSRFSVRPCASWVEQIEADVPAKPPSDQVTGGIYHLLSDRQTRVQGTGQESYGHFSKQVVNAAGLEKASQVSVDFDPSFQRLVLHSVRVRRGGVWKNRLDPRAVKLLQRESDLESQIYDGAVSAVLFVEDLRVGDVIDYAYTTVGSNPILDGRYLDAFLTEWSVPLHRMRFRILWPSGRKLFVKNHRTTIAPATQQRGAFAESVWERRDVTGIAEQSSVPAWFDTHGWVQLSEFETWAQVSEWGRRLFEVPAAEHPALVTQADSWRAKPREEAVLAALRFVQDDVRYLGIEMGTGAQRPSPPTMVLGRRYGDCKDKALLFCALLRRLGVVAHPAMVHTFAGPVLGEWQPSPYAFNHVVVRVDLGSREVWVDPTLPAQGGTLFEVWFPRYSQALVLRPGTEGLTALPPPRLAQPSRHILETYRAKDFKSPVEYTVTSRYLGPEADRMRRELRESSRNEMTATYLKYYSRIWPAISTKANLETTDDREANVLSTVEHYTIPSFWSTAKHKDRPEVELWAGGVGDALALPARTERWAPFGLALPLHVRHSTRLDLPEEWDVNPETATVQDPAMQFRYQSTCAKRTLTLDYEYQTLVDTVSAVEFPRHMQTMDRVRERLSFRLRRPLVPGGPSGRTNWTVLSVLAVLGLFGALGAVLVCRYHPGAPESPRVRAPSLQGIRGWLLLFAVYLVAGIVQQGLAAWAHRGDYSLRSWIEHTTPSADGYLPAWAPLLLATLVVWLAALAGGASMLVLLLRRRRTLLAFYAAFVALQAALFIGVALLASHVPDRRQTTTEVVTYAFLLLAPASIWIPYLFLSDRARSTLVRR